MHPFHRSVVRVTMVALSVLASALTVGLAACVIDSNTRIDDAVAAQARFFDPGAVPSDLLETLRPHRLVLLGESLYVQEHQDFVVLLLRELHPRGLRDDPPPSVARMNQTYLDGLRAFNATLPPSERIRFRYIDMNHNETAFQTSLQMMHHETDLSPVSSEIASILARDPYDQDYLEALHALRRATGPEGGTATILRNHTGDLWFSRLRETLEIEIRRFPLRLEWDVAEREVIMIDLVSAILDESRNDMVAVNTGMYHAQRQRFMGTRQFDAFIVYPAVSVLRSLRATWYTAP